MFIAWSKRVFSKIFPDNFFYWLKKIGFTPNRLTVVSTAFKLGAFFLFLEGAIFWGGVFVIFDYFFDYLDGAMARKLGMSSKRGAIYDFVSDRVIRELWIFALANAQIISFELAFFVVMIDAFSYFLSDYAELNKLRQIEWLPANHRFLIYGVFFGLTPLFLQIGVVVNGLFTVINIVSLIFLNGKKRTVGST